MNNPDREYDEAAEQALVEDMEEHDARTERMLERADYLRTERKDREVEESMNANCPSVGDCITNADLIASAPRLQRLNRDMDFAIRRLIKVFTPSPTAGIVDDAERKAAIFQQSVERSDAIEAARALISWQKAGSDASESEPLPNREKGMVCGTCQVVALGAISMRCEREGCPGRDLHNAHMEAPNA